MRHPRNRGKKSLSPKLRELILEAQGNRCRYCGVEFVLISPCFDHVVPFCHGRSNKVENFVAACLECNAIKQSLVFPTLEEAIAYVRDARLRKGLPLFDLVKSKAIESLCAGNCGTVFSPKFGKKYCSARCRNYAMWRRHPCRSKRI